MHRLLALTVAAAATTVAAAETIELTPVLDNSLIEPTGTDLRSNATGPLFSGRTGGAGGNTFRRALVEFDLSAIPAGAVVECAALTVYLDQSVSLDQTHTLHRLLDSWGEGTSFAFGGTGAPATPGDATWEHRFFPDVFWAAPGGDFVAAESSSTIIGFSEGYYTFSTTPGLVADVQAWIDDPSSNHGWMIRGNEIDTNSAKRLASRETPDEALRPLLSVRYALGPGCAGDVDGNDVVDFQDLLEVLASWGPSCACCPSDIDADGEVGFSDLLIVLSNWGDC